MTAPRVRTRALPVRRVATRADHLEHQADALKVLVLDLRIQLAESRSREAHLVGALRTQWAETQRALGREADDAFIAEAFR